MSTLREVAARAGVSIRTVRRVMYEADTVRPETVERVQNALVKLAYVPNLHARALVGGKVDAVALVVPQLTWYVSNVIVLTLQQQIAALDLHTVSFVSNGAALSQTVSEIKSLSPRAVILVQVAWHDEYCQLPDSEIPLLGIDLRSELPTEVPADTVGLDRIGAFRTATKHLLELGHCCIGLLDSYSAKGRQEGYHQALDEAGVKYRAVAVADSMGVEAPAIRNCLKDLLTRHPDLTGLVCTTDLWTQEALHHLADLGFSVPGDISLTSYSNEPWTRWTIPSLTTLDQGTAEMCEHALKMLKRRLKGSDKPWSRRTVLPELVVRGSTAPPRSR